MIAIELKGEERSQFQYILPGKGSLRAIELVEKILNKIKISDEDLCKTIKIEFEKDEIDFIKEMIKILDEQKQLCFQSLSLIKKILNIQGDLK